LFTYFFVRSVRILLLTPAFLLVFLPAALFRRPSGPTVLRWYLQTCGGVFTKLGQFLAMRYDLLPVAYCQELARLLDRLPPVPMDRIVPIIERDISQPVATAFATFDPVAIGSASLAQVHRATLPSGEQVVVKVMRPDTERRFRTDFVYMNGYAWVLGHLPFIDRGIAGIIREVIELTSRELDFRREAQNMVEMRQLMLEDDIDHDAPLLYPRLSGAHTITMEYIEGVSISQMLRAVDARDDQQLAVWAEQNITPRRAAHLILRSVLEQTMHHRQFQADPHSSNLIMRPGGTLSWLDFGVMGWLDERLWHQQLSLRVAIAEQRLQRAAEILVSMFSPVSRSQLERFEHDVKEDLRDWVRATHNPMATISEKSTGVLFLNVMRASRRAGMRVPTGLTSLIRTIMVADVITLRLDPDLDWLPSMQAFIREEQRRQAESLIRESLSLSYASDLMRLYLGAAPAALMLIDAANTTVPRLTRLFGEEPSRLEQALLVLLRYLRLAGLLVAAGGLIAWMTGTANDLLAAGIIGLSLLTAWVLTRIIRLYR
jgi:ubiquinone biosynthesis protein